MIPLDEIDRRFTPHTPSGTQPERYELLRSKAKALALQILTNTPESREQALAVTCLEEACFWANAAIERRENPAPAPAPGAESAIPSAHADAFQRHMQALRERDEFAKDAVQHFVTGLSQAPTDIPPKASDWVPLRDTRPPKPWKDLTVAEMVERLHEVIKDLQDTVHRQQELLGDLEGRYHRLLLHSHLDGKVVGAMEHLYRQPGSGPCCAKIHPEGYF